jgi:hypothetical protein
VCVCARAAGCNFKQFLCSTVCDFPLHDQTFVLNLVQNSYCEELATSELFKLNVLNNNAKCIYIIYVSCSKLSPKLPTVREAGL